MKRVSLSKAAILGLGLVLAGSGAAWADNGIAKCKDGTLGQGPSTGAAAFCASHGGLESWVALLAGPGPINPRVFGEPRKASGASN